MLEDKFGQLTKNLNISTDDGSYMQKGFAIEFLEKEIKGREIECAVLGNEKIISSEVGEIKSAEKFYIHQWHAQCLRRIWTLHPGAHTSIGFPHAPAPGQCAPQVGLRSHDDS